MSMLKEPLLHFLLAGAVLFGIHTWMNRGVETEAAGNAQPVSLGPGDVQWLAENWTTQWRRPPTEDELRGLVADYLNEQLLAREARALGLEDNDVIVRRRLAQKLTFLLEDTVRRAEPSESALQQFHAANANRFQSDAHISFRHVYFSPQRRADARSDATAALRLLLGQSTPPVGELGDRTLVASEFDDEREQSISGTFGPAFARAVFSLKPGAWSGPIESAYGLHLVLVATRQEAQKLPFSEVRERVLEAWRHEQETMAKERYLAELRRKYGIVIDDAIKPLLAPGTTAKAVRP
jgi:hypothetical protein